MKMAVKAFICGAIAAACVAAPPPTASASGQRTSDQEAALRARLEGRLLPLGEIERRVVPMMQGAEYIGFDFDSGTAIYTLKFLRNGAVIWVDVDGRSGRVIRRAGR